MNGNREYGDTRRMELLYEEFYVRLYRYALTFLGDEDESKDVVSDVFQAVWEEWQALRQTSLPTSPYLYTAVRNRCIDRLRKMRSADRYALTLKATQDFTTQEEVDEYEARIVRLREAIGQLPEADRNVLRQVYFNRLSYKEAAEKLDTSENMVHKRMVKAFRLLRELSREYDYALLLFLLPSLQ